MSASLRWMVVATMLGLFVATKLNSVSVAQTETASGATIASLEDQLQKGLNARRQIEFQFLDRIVALVDQGRLSREFVQGTFNFTRERYRDRKYRVPVFEQVLRQRAKRAGNTALNNVPTTLQ